MRPASAWSIEGVRFTVWSGDSTVARRRWHRYHNLGYDTVPSCTSRETSDSSLAPRPTAGIFEREPSPSDDQRKVVTASTS